MEENQTEVVKPKSFITKLNPTSVCLALTGISVVGILFSLATRNPLWILFFMLPTVVYEVIRTEPGASTKFSSILLLILILSEIGLILFNVNYDLASFFGTSEKYVAGYTLPLGDIRVFAPLLIGILSAILVFRTYGTYTKWLSIIIAVSALVVVSMVNPSFFSEALKLIMNSLFDRLSYSF